MLSAPLIIVLCSLHTAFATWSCVSCLSGRCLHLVVNQPCQWSRADADEAAELPLPSQADYPYADVPDEGRRPALAESAAAVGSTGDA